MTYLAFLAAALCGLAGLPLWTVAIAAAALTTLSCFRFNDSYRRAREAGLFVLMDTAVLQSLVHSLIGAGVAYAGGRFISLM